MSNSICNDEVCVIDGEPILCASDVSIAYGKNCVLKEVDLEIQPCSVTAIIGPSGCGKSSFLSCFNRMTDLVPDCKVSGKILLDGENILDPNFDTVELRKKVGMIFQKPNPFPVSIAKNITEPLRYLGIRSKEERKAIMEEVLEEVGLWDEVKDRLDDSALKLSGGQQQRLCIARAIALKPQILLMDEPCSALDPVATAKIEELIQKLRGRYTLVVVTHNLGQAQRISDQTAFFWVKEGAGALMECGVTKELFEAPKNDTCAAYLEGRMG